MEKIGKKVYELVRLGMVSYTINKDKVYTIVDKLSYDEVNDYCDHYVIKDDEGNKKDVKVWEVVFVPNTDLNERDMIDRYLSDNGIYGEVFTDFSNGEIIVSISWGDWKHDHGWCRDLMRYLGYSEDDVIVTEENGSDTYSADHYFSK